MLLPQSVLVAVTPIGSHLAVPTGLPLVARYLLGNLDTVAMDVEKPSCADITAVCSLMRYKCHVRHVTFSGTLVTSNTTERELCWRWLAFGIFFPPSKKLTKGEFFESIGVTLSVEDVEWNAALACVMADPGTALLARKSRTNRQHCSEIQISTVKQGVMFYPVADNTAASLHSLDHECELEVLVEENGWLCAVVPGIGLGWVKNDEIVGSELETVDNNSTKRGIAVKGMFRTGRGPQRTLSTFLQHFGARVSFVSPFETIGATEMTATLRCCSNLRKFAWGASTMNNDVFNVMVDAFEAGSCRKLQTLDLDLNELTYDSLSRLARCLCDPAKLPALTNLSVVTFNIEPETLACFASMLRVNKTLRFTHIPAHFQYGPERHLITPFQSERLVVKLPLRDKVAFLSVLRRKSSPSPARDSTSSESNRVSPRAGQLHGIGDLPVRWREDHSSRLLGAAPMRNLVSGWEVPQTPL